VGSDSGAGRNYDLSDYSGKTTFGSLTDVFGDRMEQTVGGATIGIARDLVSKPASAQQRLERAAENDMASQIAADTVAIIPKFKALPAGIARASLLVNPHQSATENAASFGKNMAEGVALNYVGKMMLPGSGLQSGIARNLSSPMAREIATHLSVGAGFGAVKSSFDTKNWTDESGRFAPGSLAANVVKGTATGALLNVPAGMVGVRVMQGSMALMAEGQVSQRVATTIAAAGSGYTSGALLGGIDAIGQGKSFSDTLGDMHFAGKVGLFTGGALGALDKGGLNSNYRQIIESVKRANTVALQESRVEPRLKSESRAAAAKDIEEAAAPQRRQSREEIEVEEADVLAPKPRRYSSESLDFQPRDYRVADVHRRLSNPRVETETIRVLRPDAKTKFDSFADFLEQTAPHEVKMRIYDVEGHTAKLAIEESLALRMDQSRNDRIALEYISQRKIPYDDLSSSDRRMIHMEWPVVKDHEALLGKYLSPSAAKESLPVVKARIHLIQTRPKDIPLAEDFVVLMDEIPNRGKIRRVDVMHRANSEDPWNAQKFDDPKFESAASAATDGTITFYMPEGTTRSNVALRTFIGHEFGHVAANNTPEEAAIYGLAQFLDKDIPNPNYRPRPAAASSGDSKAPFGTISDETIVKPAKSDRDSETVKYFAREYAKTNLDEDGAVHMGEEMLSPQSYRLRTLAENAPVRTVVLAKSLMKVMVSAQGKSQGTNAETIWRRLNFVEKEVYPEAIKLLERRAKNGTTTEQAASAELLGYLGNRERHVPFLRRMASDRGLAAVTPDAMGLAANAYLGAAESGTTIGGKPAAQFNRPEQGRTVADVAFDAMLRLNEGSASDQLTFLAFEGMPNSPTRSMAQDRLGRAKDSGAKDLLQLTQAAGNSDRLPELIYLMRTAPDPATKALAFSEALSMGSDNPGFRQSVIAKALETPGLAGKAVTYIRPEDSFLYEPQLRKLVKQAWDSEAQSAARELLKKMPNEIDVERAVQLLRSDNPRAMQQGVDMIVQSRTPDKRVVEPLLEAAISGPEATSRAARQALLRFNPQLVKFYAHALKARGVAVPNSVAAIYTKQMPLN
jgi:hypothetical protein